MSWSSTAIWTVDDVLTDVDDIDSFTGVGTTDAQREDNAIQRAINKAKDLMRQELEVEAARIFHQSAGYYMPEFFSMENLNPYYPNYVAFISRSFSSLETVLDTLQNFGELKWAGIAKTICVLIEYGATAITPEFNKDAKKEAEEKWEKIYNDRMALAFPLLKFDLDGNGFISEPERMLQASQMSFQRV